MPSQTQTEELDPTTARLVSELASHMLPTLTKSLTAAIPANDFSGALERSNRVSQDLRSQIEKSIRSSIEDSRAGRSVMMQSIGTLLDEILALKRSVEKMPSNFESAINKAAPVRDDNNNREYARISELLGELVTGLRNFSETYTKDSMKRELEREKEKQERQEKESHRIPDDFPGQISGIDAQSLEENNTRLDKLLNNALPSLEGLVKAQGKTQSKELADFSREINTSHEQNNLALIHEIRQAVNEELAAFNEEILTQFTRQQTEQTGKVLKLLKFLFILSGSVAGLLLLNAILLMLR